MEASCCGGRLEGSWDGKVDASCEERVEGSCCGGRPEDTCEGREVASCVGRLEASCTLSSLACLKD